LRPKPQKVLQALRRGDVLALAALGKKGAETKKVNRVRMLLLGAIAHQLQANEHICPID